MNLSELLPFAPAVLFLLVSAFVAWRISRAGNIATGPNIQSNVEVTMSVDEQAPSEKSEQSKDPLPRTAQTRNIGGSTMLVPIYEEIIIHRVGEGKEYRTQVRVRPVSPVHPYGINNPYGLSEAQTSSDEASGRDQLPH